MSVVTLASLGSMLIAHALAWTAALALQASDTPKIGLCDPRGGPALQWSAEERREVRRRTTAACRTLGASPAVCAWIDVVRARESSGRPSVRHTRGASEDGLGLLGLDQRSHRDKWPGPTDPAWCTPEASVIVALAIGRRAVERHGMTTISGVQAVFSMRQTYRDEQGRRHVAIEPRSDARLCAAMEARGHGCRETVEPRDFGVRIPVSDRPARARELADDADIRPLL